MGACAGKARQDEVQTQRPSAAPEASSSPAAAAAATAAAAAVPAATAATAVEAAAAAAAAAVELGQFGATPDALRKAAAAVGDPLLTAIIVETPNPAAGAVKHARQAGRTMDYASLPYPADQDRLCDASETGPRGDMHEFVTDGVAAPHNQQGLVKTMQALKLFSAEPCPEMDVLLAVSTKLMGTSASCVQLWGGPAGNSSWVCNGQVFITGFYPWKILACPWDLLVPYPALMVVEDMRADARTAHLPHTQAGMRMYLSSPIIASDGHRLGSFCMIDYEAIRVDIGRCRLITNFAEVASRELERYAGVKERLKDKDDLVHQVYTNSKSALKRNLASSYDSCIIIVDVANNFEVMYANASWEQWSGGVPREEIVGKHLPDLLESATNVVLSWSHLASDATGGERFLVPRVRARSLQPGGAGTAAPPSTVFDISFRCGAVEPLDNDTLPIALPTFVDLSTQLGGIYFGRLHAVHDSSASYHPLDSLASVGAASKMTAAQMARLVIPSLKLGNVLGQGGFATAYVAEWHDTRVVCKVQDHLLRSDKQRALAESEIALSQELCHPNIIRTLAHGTIQLERPLPPAARTGKDYDNFLETLADMVDFHVDDFDECAWNNYHHDSLGEEISTSKPLNRMQYMEYCHGVIDASAVAPGGAEDGSSGQHFSSRPMTSRTASRLPVLMEDSIAAAATSATDSNAYSATGGPITGAYLSAIGDGGSSGASAALPDAAAAAGDTSHSLGTTTATAGGALEPPPLFKGTIGNKGAAGGIISSRDSAQSPLDLVVSGSGYGPTSGGYGPSSSCYGTCSGGSDAGAGAGGGGLMSLPFGSSTDFAGTTQGGASAGGYKSSGTGLVSYNSVASTVATSVATSTYQYPVELRSFIVIEFCDKGSLQDGIDRGWLRQQRHGTSGPVVSHVLRTALDVAEAMTYLHAKNIIHGDLSPFNVLLKSIQSDAKLRGVEEGTKLDQYGRDFVAKVSDFGTSRRLPVAAEYIRTESYATVTHMPPEMLSGSRLSFAVDVWAFGVMLWSMWTGARPWAGLSHAQIVAVVVDNTHSLQWPAGMPPRLEALGRRCLAREAAERPSFSDICAVLRVKLAELVPADLV